MVAGGLAEKVVAGNESIDKMSPFNSLG